MSCILQSLLHTPVLREYFLSGTSTFISQNFLLSKNNLCGCLLEFDFVVEFIGDINAC